MIISTSQQETGPRPRYDSFEKDSERFQVTLTRPTDTRDPKSNLRARCCFVFSASPSTSAAWPAHPPRLHPPPPPSSTACHICSLGNRPTRSFYSYLAAPCNKIFFTALHDSRSYLLSDLSVGLSVKDRFTLTGKSSATGSESEIGLKPSSPGFLESGLGLRL